MADGWHLGPQEQGTPLYRIVADDRDFPMCQAARDHHGVPLRFDERTDMMQKLRELCSLKQHRCGCSIVQESSYQLMHRKVK